MKWWGQVKLRNVMNNNETPKVGYTGGYIVVESQFQHLEGRLLTLVEALGLRESQEKSVKDLIRSEVWQTLNPCFWINGDEHTRLRETYKNFDNSLPRGVK